MPLQPAESIKRVRIAQVSPLWERVPPPAYGGIEAVVAALTEGLVKRGHDVTLYASGDSQTSARLRAIVPRPLRASNVERPLPYALVHLASLLGESASYDIVHNHCGELLMPFSSVTATPMLTTVHGPMASDTRIVWDHYSGYFNTISHAQTTGFPNQRNLGVVYNGIDVGSYPFETRKDDYLLFLGRICEEKGTHLAIQVARAIGRRLIIAGKVDRVDREYYQTLIAPAIDGPLISYVGEADAERKRQLYARSQCLLYPVTWPEPFGLVMAEAMACGTPVIGLRRGSVPEIIRDGETGFVVDSVEEMIARIGCIGQIEPTRCRARVAQCFSADQMVRRYEAVYERILAQPGAGSALDPCGKIRGD